MRNKKTILHLITNLARGGAETMLVRFIRELTEYNNIVVTLQRDNHFEDELVCDKYICLNKSSLPAIPFAAWQLRKIIKSCKADIVHSHLPVSNFTARLATPAGIPLITTIHNSIATSKDYKHSFIRLLDKATYYFKKSTIIAVSKGAMDDYFSVLKIKPGNAVLLYNFVDTAKYNSTVIKQQHDTFKVVCVGALSVQKNIGWLIHAFKELKNENIELHIYGQGGLQKELQDLIDQYDVSVILKGQVKNIHEVLPAYDLYVMSSLFEGFSLSVLEAMALQMPLLLSDIPSFREQCADTAMYFDLNNVAGFVQKIKTIAADKNLQAKMGLAAKERAVNNFTLEKYMAGLREIYLAALNQQL